jgi:1-acyl-sn-glycerol-3-phosphate acyltransferase
MRLVWRAPLAVATLALFFLIFVIVRSVGLILVRTSGRPVGRLGAGAISIWARLSLSLIGLRLRIIGAPMKVPGAYVVNHASWIDVIVLQAAATPYLVAKAEVRTWPVIGAIGAAIGTIFVERTPVAARGQGDELRARMIKGDRVALFPEGTSSDGLRVLPFKTALFAAFVDQGLGGHFAVQPVAIRYRTRDDLPDTFYAWWGDAEFGTHLADVLARSSGGTVTLSFLAPLEIDQLRDRKLAARTAEENVRREFERLSADVR